MDFAEFFYLLRWDFKINHGWSWDCLRARLLLLEVRFEQLVHRNLAHIGFLRGGWYLCRFFGSIYQWLLCNSNLPGTLTIGRGLRLPHPQNIILAGFAEIGEFCTIYHNVSVAWNGFIPVKPLAPKIGNQVLLGAGTILVGDICIGSDVLIGAGAVVTKSVPDFSRVTCARAEVCPRQPTENAVTPGSDRHIRDPYSIWR